ncbi:MAG: cyclic nucleotide-binding protein, partial [Oricola sp.]
QVVRINRSLFRRMLEEYPESAAVLHDRLSEQLHRLIGEIGALEDRFSEG